MIEALFGPGPAAGWIALLYFVAGALGTACRVMLSPTLESKSGRMVWEVILGGAGGILLPQLGFAMFGADLANAFTPIAKAAAVLVLTGTGSFVVGELLARRRNGTGPVVKMIAWLVLPAALLAGCAQPLALLGGPAQQQKAVKTIGQTIHEAKEAFARADDKVNAWYSAKAITDAEYKDWAEFSTAFLKGWEAAKQAYAVGVNPVAIRGQLDALQAEVEIYLLKLARGK